MELNENHIQTVGQIVLRLSRDEGAVIPIDQIVSEATEEGITEAEVKVALDQLAEEGEISKLDDSSIQVNM